MNTKDTQRKGKKRKKNQHTTHLSDFKKSVQLSSSKKQNENYQAMKVKTFYKDWCCHFPAKYA